jgi:tetratricopeptide (TPR) repeat protein
MPDTLDNEKISLPSAGRRFALIVGCNNSSYIPPDWSTLESAEKDARDVAYHLEQLTSGFKLLRPAITGEDATAPNIRQAMRELVKRRTKDDSLLFYFSGHAQPMKNDVFLVTHDFSKEDVDVDPDGYLSRRWLRDVLYNSKGAGNVLIILDCCYAGNITNVREDFLQINFRELLDAWDAGTNDKGPPDRSRLYLAAAGYNAQAEEKDGHGIMTRYLIQALAGDERIMDQEGKVDVYSLHKFLLNHMSNISPLSGEIAQEYVLAYHPELSVHYRKNKEEPMLQQIYEHIKNQARPPFRDTMLCEGALFEHLDRTKIADFLSKPLVRQDPRFSPSISEQEQLERLGFLRDTHPTYGALLCFGEDPSQWVESAITHCYDSSKSTDSETLSDDKKYRKGLLHQFEESSDFLFKHLKSIRTISKEGGKDELEIPYRVFWEALANALMHREYEGRTDLITVEIHRDQIEISSPGVPPENISVESLLKEHSSHRRNPQIAEIFHLYGIVEERGKGIEKMLRFMEEVGLPEPKFEITRDKRFKVTLYRPVEVPSHELHGLYMWIEADLHRYRNLREKFVNLSQVFDDWLASEPQKRGRRIRVLWLQGEEGIHRNQALMSCLVGVPRGHPTMYDAGTDSGLLAETLNQFISSESYPIPPLISIEQSDEDHRTAWTNVRNTLASVERHFAEGHQAYPRLIVAGTGEQAQEAWQILQEHMEIKIIDTKGRDLERPYSFHGVHGMDSATVFGDDIFNRGLPITAKRLFGREDELETLTRAWNSERCRILSLVASGGTGKSALVNTWLSQMHDQDYLGARKVFAWSFYSQGTKENLVSADMFVNQAITWLAPDEPIPLNPWAQGLTLARLIKKHRFLLVLDGLEPLQHPLSAPDVGGQLTDDSIRALLEELSDPSDWKGLCVITTRVPLMDLRRFEDGKQKEMGRVVQLELENLDYQAGAALLKYLIKTDARQRDLEKAVEEVQGHALAITLLGNYLRDVHHGDLAGRFDLEKLTVAGREGGHARQIMASYVQWLQKNRRFSELALLHVIGLFDRPAPPAAMSALLKGMDRNLYLAELDRVGSDVWNRCVDSLRGMGLLNKENPEWPGTIDAHPLVREHFRDELQRGDGQLWTEGNRILFAYYRDTAPPLPDDSKGMNILYAAVNHGCAAGLYQEVFDELLLTRIWRGRRAAFSTRRLGMIGSDLVALSNYFQHRQWTQLRELTLSERARVLILTNAGVRLRQLGRLVEARQCFGAVMREIESSSVEAQESEDASYAAAQYCELLVIAGKLIGTNGDHDAALINGQIAIVYADRGNDPYFSMHARSSLAEVHFMLGDLEKANALFGEARAIEQKRHPKPPFLYSQSLFRYGYYLIETGRANKLLADAHQRVDWGTNGEDSSLLSKAIRLLILGAAQRALIKSAKRSQRMRAFIDETEKILNDSIIEFRRAGYADYTVRGLLERAFFYRIRHFAEDYHKALEDLDQATFEAERGQMELLYADILLQRLACYLDFWPTMSNTERADIRDKAAKTLKEATDLIEKLHYRRRQAMLADLQTVAAELGVPDEPFGTNNHGAHP